MSTVAQPRALIRPIQVVSPTSWSGCGSTGPRLGSPLRTGGVVGRGDPDFEQESGESDGASPSSSSSSSDPSAREGSEEKVTTKVAAVTRKWLLV